MDTVQITEFEQVLKKTSSKKQALYTSSKNIISSEYKIKDVLLGVSKQIKALNNADFVKTRQQHVNKLQTSGKSELLPLNLLSNRMLGQENQNKFETQCVTDTQLINLVEDVEAQEAKSGITQEFAITFCKKEQIDNSKTSRPINQGENSLKAESYEEHVNNGHYSSQCNTIEINSDLFRQNIPIKQNVPQHHTECSDTEDAEFFEALGECLVKSPILNKIKPLIIRSTPPSLVCKLEYFEKFEALAVPIIEEYSDICVAKKFINSQIVHDTLYKDIHSDTFLKYRKREKSPVFELKTVNKKNSDIVTPSCSHSMERTNQNIIEDEILFSSDEENDHLINNAEDLPLTCVLETSFYNHTGVLDETLYVGFQTASNKAIQINRESFNKAKSFVDLNENVEFKHLVNTFDKSFKSFDNLNKLSIDSAAKNRKILPENQILGITKENVIDDNILSVGLKEKELLRNSDNKLKRQFEEGNIVRSKRIKHLERLNTEQTTQPDVKNWQKPNDNIETKGLQEGLIKINDDNIIQEFETSLIQDENVKKCEKSSKMTRNTIDQNCAVKSFKGFQTASFKPIQISEEAIVRTKQIFESIESDVETNLLDTSKENKLLGFTRASNNNIALTTKPKLINPPLETSFVQINSSDTKTQENISALCNLTSFNGFSTASNKEIKVSMTALLKSKTLFQAINNDSNLNDNVIEKNLILHNYESFKTASNKPIYVSKEALLRSEKTFKDIDVIPEIDDVKSRSNKVYKPGIPLEGFRSANNKPIHVLNIFQDASQQYYVIKNVGIRHGVNEVKEKLTSVECKSDSSEEIKTYPNQLKEINSVPKFHFQTASNKPVEISDKSLAASQKLLNNNNENHPLSANVCAFKGFQTASNKQIKISKEKLAKGIKIFDGISLNVDEEFSIPQLSKVNIMHETACFKPSISYIRRPSNENEPSVKDSEKTFKGFQTASNKKVIVTKEALAKCKKIFDDIDIELEYEFSENNLDYPKSILNTETTHAEANFQFHTANNNPVFVAKEAITASQSLFNKNIDEKYINSSERVVFQTACNKPVEISKETLARKMLDDIDVENNYTSNSESAKFSKTPKFQFQTANNKLVDVGEEAIIASQKLINSSDTGLNNLKGCQTARNKNDLDDVDFNTNSGKVCYVLEKTYAAKTATPLCGFKRNKNKIIDVSEHRLEIPKKPFQNIEQPCEENVKLNNFLDTQVISNFEQTLYTEDFLKDRTPEKCKRSGSPILSCPKAKKRRFEAPVSVENKKTAQFDSCQNYYKNTFTFDKNYKTVKMFKLKDLNEIDNKYKVNNTIDTNIYNFNFENILQFEFKDERNELTEAIWNTDNIKQIFMDSINKKNVPLRWIENHMKLIIWKLISYEIKYPNIFHRVCTVRNVMEQLKYRYDRELYHVQRPALRKILEKDDVSSKTMVLCVVGVYVDGANVSSVANLTDAIELLLTDGWYCIKACIDKLIAKYVYDGRITVGSKLITHGAELVNCEQGIAPWEDTSSVRLKMFGNSTRRARWDTRLGYHGNAAILTELSSVKPEGGKVSKMQVFVTRVYPTLYVEKFDDGSTVTRSERLENIYQMKYESDRQMLLEKIYEDVEKEFYDHESQYSEDLDVERKLDSGSQIARLMKKHRDPAEFKASLTESQMQLYQEYSRRHKDKQIEQVQNMVREKIRNSSLGVARNVVPLMKIRVASVEKDLKITKGMVSIWRPNEAIQEVITEGTWIDIYNVVPTAVRYSEIQLSASRQSIFQNSKIKESRSREAVTDSLKRRCYHIQNVARNPKKITDYNEIDTVGFIFLIEPSNLEFDTSEQLFQNVFLADEYKNEICVNFWGGIKKFGFENILETGEIIACVNLQKRSGSTIKSILQYRATEFSYFTKTPKYDCLRKLSQELIKTFSGLDKRKFQEDCIALKNNFAIFRLGNNVSPYRMNNSDYNISKNKTYIDSPLDRDANLALSGLDFESTFKQRDTQDMSSQEILRKKKVNEKIAKLKIYGEPPPLSTINIINRSKDAVNAFKSPLTTRNDIKVATEGKSTSMTQTIDKENSNLGSSPVLPLSKYGKRPSVNPVKLVFNNLGENENNTVDPFADELDASPPLSLD